MTALLPGAVSCQPDERSPDEIIRHLTYQNRAGRRGLAAFDCGSSLERKRDNREVANSLVRLGGSAVPDLDKAIDSISKNGEHSTYAINAEWLLYAYATIKGPTSSPRFWRLIEDSKVEFLRPALDDSLALALGLTSYVDSRRLLAKTFTCRHPQPRDALNLLVLAWLRGDRQWLEASLGPNAMEALRATAWADLRVRVPSYQKRVLAVGYRFEPAGSWSQPELTLDPQQPESVHTTENPELDTTFVDRSGAGCGTHHVRFLMAALQNTSRASYLVDSSDLRELLELVSSCASK
jgi:hypothetical protein